MIKKCLAEGQDQYAGLLELRCTPRQGSGVSLAQCVFGRRSLIPSVKACEEPNLHENGQRYKHLYTIYTCTTFVLHIHTTFIHFQCLSQTANCIETLDLDTSNIEHCDRKTIQSNETDILFHIRQSLCRMINQFERSIQITHACNVQRISLFENPLSQTGHKSK